MTHELYWMEGIMGIPKKDIQEDGYCENQGMDRGHKPSSSAWPMFLISTFTHPFIGPGCVFWEGVLCGR